MRFKILSFWILLICFAATAFAQPQTKEELSKKKQQIQREIDELNDNLRKIQNNKSQAIKIASLVENKINARERLIGNISKDIKRLEEEVYVKQVEIYRLKNELDTLKQKYAQSLVFAYKNRTSYQYLNFLFSADNFNDAIKRVVYLKSYRQLRETEAQNILKTKDILQSSIANLNNSRVEQKTVLQTHNEQLQTLEQDKQEKDKAVKQLKDQEKDVAVQLKKREKQRQELNNAINAAIRREIAEAERKEKERLAKIKADEELRKKQAAAAAKEAADNLKNTTNTNKPPTIKPGTVNPNLPGTVGGITPAKPGTANPSVTTTPKTRDYNVLETNPDALKISIDFEHNKGKLSWPVSTGSVTGRFGVQNLSVHMKVENDGIFISTPVGSQVRCVAEGDVATVFHLADYQSIMVRHGKYYTVYNKISEVNVTKGQHVSAGTILGKAAADEAGEGEIEFRVMNGNKQWVNPENWLKPR